MNDLHKATQIGKRGQRAKGRLLQTALDVFGARGFDAATTRLIAHQADVNIAAIPYYFGGKKELYHAVVEHVAARLFSQIGPELEQIAAWEAADGLCPSSAMSQLENLLAKMCDFIVGSREAARFARIILREQLIPSTAYDIIYARVMEPFLGTASKLIAVITGSQPGRRTSMRALALFGQVIAFRVARETMVRALGLEGYSTDETEEIRGIILEHTRAALRFRNPGQACF